VIESGVLEQKNVLLVHPQFNVVGGAELVALHILRWLTQQRAFRTTVVTLRKVDVEAVHSMTGVDIDPRRIEVRLAYCPKQILEAESRFELMKLAFLHRAARKLSPSADLCLSTYGEMDFGKQGFQYIHHPSFADKSVLRRYAMIGKENALLRAPGASVLYRKTLFGVSGDSPGGFARNVTAVNSHFTGEIVREVYGIDATVLSPGFLPARRKVDLKPWGRRQFRFVAVGRIAPDKCYLQLLDLFNALSKRFNNAAFTIVGAELDATYAREVRRKTQELHLPVEFVTSAGRKDVDRLLQTSTFFVHAKPFEHFGIAIVEAMAQGCLPFVHDSGGQVEIVTPKVLRYLSEEDLVRNVESIMRDGNLRRSVQHELLLRARRFTCDVFLDGLEGLLEPLL
jgi:glycosyltransferase involved in cell wall biosynthesis